jgi:hypothetical protein
MELDMQILRDQIWQFIGAILTLITVVISIYAYFKQRGTKHIHCEVVSNSSVVSISNAIKPDIQIFYKGKLTDDLRLIIIKLQNTGTLPISSKDYEESIQIYFGEAADILDIELVEFSPKSLVPQFTNNVNTLILKPLLLNPNDMFILKVIARKASEIIEVKARILGVSDITKSVSNFQISGIHKFTFYSILIIASAVLGFLLSSPFSIQEDLNTLRVEIQQLELQSQQLETEKQFLELQLHNAQIVVTAQAQPIQTSILSTATSP